MSAFAFCDFDLGFTPKFLLFSYGFAPQIPLVLKIVKMLIYFTEKGYAIEKQLVHLQLKLNFSVGMWSIFLGGGGGVSVYLSSKSDTRNAENSVVTYMFHLRLIAKISITMTKLDSLMA